MLCVGYAGWEAFDLVLYLGRTLAKLQYRVLIVDISDTGALCKSIKHGMGLDSRKDIINYRNINYTRKIPSEEEFDMFRDGVILVVYGCNYRIGFPISCRIMNVVVNTFPHIIDEVNILLRDVSQKENHIRLLIRDVISVDDVELVKRSLDLPAKLNDVSYIYLDYADYESAVGCELTKVVRFAKISSRMKGYIADQIHGLFPSMNQPRIKKAIRMAGRGS